MINSSRSQHTTPQRNKYHANCNMARSPENGDENVYLQRIDSVGVTLQRVEAGLRVRVPHPHRVVVGTGHNPLPVELYAAHGRHMAQQRVQAHTLVDVPNAKSGVPRPADNTENTQVGVPKTDITSAATTVTRAAQNTTETSVRLPAHRSANGCKQQREPVTRNPHSDVNNVTNWEPSSVSGSCG